MQSLYATWYGNFLQPLGRAWQKDCHQGPVALILGTKYKCHAFVFVDGRRDIAGADLNKGNPR